MIRLRPANERGHANYGWLDTHYSFSFNTYYDPKYMGFSDLRVINEDYVQGGQGFGTHGHRDMEILTYIVEGALEHRDSTGGHGVIRPHEWQRMSAGTGVRHSEFNASETERVHLLQIWILPEREGIQPGYEQKMFAPEEKKGVLKLVASRGGQDGSLNIHQDAAVYNAILAGEEKVEHNLGEGRSAWLQIVRGAVTLNNVPMQAGDGAAVSEETLLTIQANEPSEVILFDLA